MCQELPVEQMQELGTRTISGKKMDFQANLEMSQPIKRYYKHMAGFLLRRVPRYCIMVMNMVNMAEQTQITDICTVIRPLGANLNNHYSITFRKSANYALSQ